MKNSIRSGAHLCPSSRLFLATALVCSSALAACGNAGPDSTDESASTVATTTNAVTTVQAVTSTTVDAYAAEYEVFCAELVRRVSKLDEDRTWSTYVSLDEQGPPYSDFDLGSMFQLEDEIQIAFEGAVDSAPTISEQRARADEYYEGADEIHDRLENEVRVSKKAEIQRELDAYYAAAPEQPFIANISNKCDLPGVSWETLLFNGE